MPIDLPPPDPGIELFTASHGMSQGLLQTTGPQVIPRATLRVGAAQIGAQWRNVSSPAASGIAALFVKLRGHWGKAEFETVAAYRIRTGATGSTDRAAWEFGGTLRRSFGKAGMRALVEFAPAEFEAGPSLYVELGPTLSIADGTIISVNVARREREGPDYTAINAGITQRLNRSVVFDARLYATDHPRRGQRYRTRLIVSARVTL